MNEVIPWLYLRGISTGQFQEALEALVGPDATRSLQAKADLQEIWMAETKGKALKAFDTFIARYEAKYPGAVKCLTKDKDVLLTFYDFPAEHWRHLRTTNPIESTFSTVRLRHRRTKGSGRRRACLAIVFKLTQIAQSRWRCLSGAGMLVRLLDGCQFVDGIAQKKDEKDAA